MLSLLTTNQKGAIAETAIAHAALKLGVGVYHSYADERCDFIFDLRPRLVRVQCKWARRYGDIVAIRLYSARRTAAGLTRRVYSRDDVDAFAAYCLETGRCYFFDWDAVGRQSSLFLRLSGAKNNQRAGIRWAKDYEFEATIGSYGAVAQLGERLAGSQ